MVTAVLKQSLKDDVQAISIAGGKGRKSTKTKYDITRLAEAHYNLSSDKIDNLLHTSRIQQSGQRCGTRWLLAISSCDSF